jgi:hypothetical protein
MMRAVRMRMSKMKKKKKNHLKKKGDSTRIASSSN